MRKYWSLFKQNLGTNKLHAPHSNEWNQFMWWVQIQQERGRYLSLKSTPCFRRYPEREKH